MKNAILTLAFVLFTAVGFADQPKEREELPSACVDVTLSCGVSGEACVTDMDMLMRHIAFAEAYWCE